MTYVGRGAWSAVGGTLTTAKGSKVTVPGPYYMRPSKGVEAPGVAADNALLKGETPDLNEHAVWFGVLAIKTRLLVLIPDSNLIMNGRYGPAVADAVKEFQVSYGLPADGIVGPKTSKALFRPLNEAVGAFSQIGAVIGCGVITNESAWDPGAVGKSDYGDHGLCQLNQESQGFNLTQSFDPYTAMTKMYALLDGKLDTFGNVDDAIAAYNLGDAGCRLWIKEGRPDMFLPLSLRPDGKPRFVRAYIERIKIACL
jgi:hypothetical protein